MRFAYKVLIVILLALIGALSGCAHKLKGTLDFNPADPLRVAVLPFYQIEKGELVSAKVDSSLLVDNVPLVSSKLSQSPTSLVQGQVQQELADSGLDVVSPGYVLAQLGHHGFVGGGEIIADRLLEAPVSKLGELLSADAILYGQVTKCDRTYLALESVSTVGVSLKLVRAADGKVLFTSESEQSEGRGLSGIPTGFSSLFIEPIRGLDNDIIVALSQRTVKDMLKPLMVKSRPEYLASSGPALFAAAHNSGPRRGKPLSVLALGSPEQEAYFSLGTAYQRIPMFERDPGHYVGQLAPDKSVKLDAPVRVVLRDKFGRETARVIPEKIIRE